MMEISRLVIGGVVGNPLAHILWKYVQGKNMGHSDTQNQIVTTDFSNIKNLKLLSNFKV